MKTGSKSCEKEYCRLGCICDSLNRPSQKPSSNAETSHCGKTECMLKCICTPGDDKPIEKPEITTADPVSSNPATQIRAEKEVCKKPIRPKPPIRERSHRAAKNLDAISRKAILFYQTSEIYALQSRRKKVI